MKCSSECCFCERQSWPRRLRLPTPCRSDVRPRPHTCKSRASPTLLSAAQAWRQKVCAQLALGLDLWPDSAEWQTSGEHSGDPRFIGRSGLCGVGLEPNPGSVTICSRDGTQQDTCGRRNCEARPWKSDPCPRRRDLSTSLCALGFCKSQAHVLRSGGAASVYRKGLCLTGTPADGVCLDVVRHA